MHIYSNESYRYKQSTDGDLSGEAIPKGGSANNSGEIFLDARRKKWQWLGVIACRSCPCTAFICMELVGPDVPAEIACPKCSASAEPSSLWNGAWRVNCPCKSNAIHVVFSDMLPVAVVTCPCGKTHPVQDCEDFAQLIAEVKDG